jgi:hypothetical protein
MAKSGTSASLCLFLLPNNHYKMYILVCCSEADEAGMDMLPSRILQLAESSKANCNTSRKSFQQPDGNASRCNYLAWD